MELLPTLDEIRRNTTPMQQWPNLFWVVPAEMLAIIAGFLAKERRRREQAAESEARGWQFSADWSPIREEDWRQLSENSDFAALAFTQKRQDFIWGTHLGTDFVMFQEGNRVKLGAESSVPETMIAFEKPADLPTVQSTIAGGGSSNRER